MNISRDAIEVVLALLALGVHAWITFMASAARERLDVAESRRSRAERDGGSAERSHSILSIELSNVHQHAQAVLRAVREHPDEQAIRAACLASVEPIVVLRQTTSSGLASRRTASVPPAPLVPAAVWVDGSFAVALALVLSGVAAYLLATNVLIAGGVAAVSGLIALVRFQRVFATRRDVEMELNGCHELAERARQAATIRDLQRSYGEYLNTEVGRFLLALGNGHLPLDEGTRDAARVLSLRLEAALPPGSAT